MMLCAILTGAGSNRTRFAHLKAVLAGDLKGQGGRIMRIRLRSFGSLRRYLGRDLIIEIDEGSLLRDVLLSLPEHERLLDGLKIRDDIYVLVNGRSVSDINTALNDGDEISIVPAIIGG